MGDVPPKETPSSDDDKKSSDQEDLGEFTGDKDKAYDPEILSREKDSSNRLIRREFSVTWQGPLPPPEEIEKYNQIIPNGADRLMAMAESEQSHRHKIESIVVNSVSSQNKRGQWFAFILSVSVLIVAAYLFYIDKDGYAVGLVTADFLVIAGAFIGLRLWASKNKDQEQSD